MATQAQTDIRDTIARQALILAGEKGWAETGLPEIAAACGLDLAGLRAHCEDKADILAAFGRMIDRGVLENAGTEEGASVRDKLFDLMMERYEALNEFRSGVVSVLKSFRLDPKQALISCPYLCRSMSWMLEAAGAQTAGIAGAVKVAGLVALHLKVLCVWIDDESADLAKTMAALDRDLARAESLANNFGF